MKKGRYACNTDTKQSWNRKSKYKKDIVFPVTKTVMKAREIYKKMVVKNDQVTEEIFELWTKNSIDGNK